MHTTSTPDLQARLADLVTAAAARAAHAVCIFLASTAGPRSERRRSSGSYEVIRNLERYPQALHLLDGQPLTQAPHMDTVEVLALPTPPTPSTLVLLEAQRAPLSTCLTFPPDPTPPLLVASRRYDARWPEELRAAYRACLAAHLAWSAACDTEWIHYGNERPLLGTPSGRAIFEAWRSLEQEWLPRFQAWEAEAAAEAASGGNAL